MKECKMKIIVAGGRHYRLNKFDLLKLHGIENISELVSGGSRGVDTDAEQWASMLGIPFKQFKPNWKQYGRGAGPIRNKDMAKYADALVLFPGGRGTLSMYNEARKEGLIIYDYRNT